MRKKMCFLFNETATKEIYKISLQDARQISKKVNSHQAKKEEKGGKEEKR